MKIEDLEKTTTYLIIMTGISGSGKSTFAKKIQSILGCNLVETDYIREQLTGDAGDQSKNGLVFSVAQTQIKTYLNENKTVIFDATNLSIKDRKDYIQIGKGYGNVSVGSVYMIPNISIANTRNNLRVRVVPPEVILRQYQKFKKPSTMEGFDFIITVNND
jgi:predicted kinase